MLRDRLYAMALAMSITAQALSGSCHCFRHAPGLRYAMPLEAEG